jgi:Cdc6-like AAA superfamily ATPase
MIIDEFNCNHQADANGGETIEIYERDNEIKYIKKFLLQNIEAKKSGLLYLCGHPGTGKTSTLNVVISEVRNHAKSNSFNPIEVFIHNAMTYNDVKTYGIQILKEIFMKQGI